MNRTIKFRGLRVDGQGWAYGDFVQWIKREKAAILPPNGDEWTNPFDFEVNPETVGQFTGLLDKNGKEIYEGDKIRHFDADWFASVEWDDCGKWTLRYSHGRNVLLGDRFDYIEVFGNIHEQ